MTTGLVPRAGPWLWGPRVDLGVFLAPTLVAIALTLIARATFGPGAKLDDWGWVVIVIGVDVAHVWSTLFRTYLDPAELRRRPRLYSLVPIACWATGVALHHHSPGLFWRALAYVAVWHFVRQQAGWAAVYRARAGTRSRTDRYVDDAAIYLSTGVPLLLWHARLPRPFWWFVEGDFVAISIAPVVERAAQALLATALVVFALYHARLARLGRPVPLGKLAVVATTAVGWYGGIVVVDDDVGFTLLNVLPHGVPYFALLWAYARARRREAPRAPGSRVVALGLAPFLALLVALAFAEEAAWDGLVWHDRAWLFGDFWPSAETVADLLVPLLALPQATHYVLDAVLWRRGAGGTAQAAAFGFRPNETATHAA